MTSEQENVSYSLLIGGVKVYFPMKAYPSQISMMDKVIRGCHKAQNCLLESPTGSGKTLALLCGALSWQKCEAKRLAELAVVEAKQQMEEKLIQAKKKREKEMLKKLQETLKDNSKNSETVACAKETTSDAAGSNSITTTNEPDKTLLTEEEEESDIDSDPEESAVFVQTPKNKQKSSPIEKRQESLAKRLFQNLSSKLTSSLETILLSSSSDSSCGGNKTVITDSSCCCNTGSSTNDSPLRSSNSSPMEQKCLLSSKGSNIDSETADDICLDAAADTSQTNNVTVPIKKHKVPKIYFGTRTHKQIAQVVKELNRTYFASDVRISVLASRTHTCVHPLGNRPNVNKTELCRQLREPVTGEGCKYNMNVPKYGHHQLLHNARFPNVWDIEDLVNFGKKHSTCPYYTARSLVSSANIIFCPYNYLVDPSIRKAMNIRLKGEIIILDEAHNIEDTCRESASFDLEQTALLKAIQECEKIANEERGCFLIDNIRQIAAFLKSISHWIDEKQDSVTVNDYNKGTLTYSGFDAVESFGSYGFGRSAFETYQANVTKVLSPPAGPEKGEENDVNKSTTEADVTINAALKIIFENLAFVLGFLFNDRYTDDYQIALTKVLVTNTSFENSDGPDDDGWYRPRKKPKPENHWKHTLHFWCLNPAVTFDEIKESARCVILTSGTLSPIGSFQSELGTEFPIKLEANHVIGQSQCWVGSLGVGPNNVPLTGVFNKTCTYEFQDELGELILKVCSFVPHGVLCFLPSYHLMDKLYERWSSTNVLKRILKHKHILREPRHGDQLDTLMQQFYRLIDSSASSGVIGQSITGVLFLAVCRGKVSEGLDFADDYARIVITVGIPFPNVKDFQVILKKSYNDKRKNEKGLLSGHDWYQIQAFRALNQALGRCIRHRNDWGAILLVDGRFANQGYNSSLSKWVRNKITHHNNWNTMIQNLELFMRDRLNLTNGTQ